MPVGVNCRHGKEYGNNKNEWKTTEITTTIKLFIHVQLLNEI